MPAATAASQVAYHCPRACLPISAVSCAVAGRTPPSREQQRPVLAAASYPIEDLPLRVNVSAFHANEEIADDSSHPSVRHPRTLATRPGWCHESPRLLIPSCPHEPVDVRGLALPQSGPRDPPHVAPVSELPRLIGNRHHRFWASCRNAAAYASCNGRGVSARVVARKSPAAKPSPEAVIADRKVKPTMPDHTTAPVTVNRFEGVLDGTPAAAARFVERVLALPHVEGPVELPSGRMVATYDPEYLDWFFATAWGTTKKAAAWLGVPEQLFLIACNVAA